MSLTRFPNFLNLLPFELTGAGELADVGLATASGGPAVTLAFEDLDDIALDTFSLQNHLFVFIPGSDAFRRNWNGRYHLILFTTFRIFLK